MKTKKIILSLLLCAALALSVFALVACGDEEPEQSGPVLEFVAADKTNWDKEVTFGEKKFTLLVTLNADKTLTLNATCTGKAEASGGSGGGFPGGGFPFAQSAEETAEDETEEEEDTTDYSVYSFSLDGSWSEEAGWGYTLEFGDTAKTKIVADYDTTMGRHYFYYYMSPTVGGEAVKETQVQFQAKDSAYRKSLNANYVINEERTCTYMFRGGGFNSNTGNKTEARIFLLPGGKAITYAESGSTLTYYGSSDTWTEDTAAKSITFSVNGATYTTNAYCDETGKEGYRAYYSSYSVYCAVADGMTWDQYTAIDFEGPTILTLTGTGADAAYTLALTEKGYANILNNGSSAVATTYTTDGSGNYSLSTQYGTYTSRKESTTVTITVNIPITTGFGPWATTTETPITFTADVA